MKHEFNWSDLAFSSKRSVRELKATFIAAPREISLARFVQIVKAYLPKGNLVLGIASEQFIMGFESQPQFKTLQIDDLLLATIEKINTKSPHKVYVLRYNQIDTVHILEADMFKRVILVNGSWLHSFHLRPEYFALVGKRVSFELVSPFTDEAEAKMYAETLAPQIAYTPNNNTHTELELLREVKAVAIQSYDTSFQIGVIIASQQKRGHKIELARHNIVVPYETFAWHHGASRERHFSQPGDISHYDTIHAEMAAIIDAGQNDINLKDKTMFINVLPCPTCARSICHTDIAEIVYSLDHSNGYAVALLEAAGKKVRRVVNLEDAI